MDAGERVIGAGTVINPIIKIVTTVVILGAVYLFFVKPALDTTKDISNRAFDTSNSIQEEIQQDLRESFRDIPSFNATDVQIPDSASKAQKLGDCVNGAAGNVDKIERCMSKFAP